MAKYYCLLHNKDISRAKAFKKCRANKPHSLGMPYQRTRKSQSDFRCRHLLKLGE